jgi:hypothetical protein
LSRRPITAERKAAEKGTPTIIRDEEAGAVKATSEITIVKSVAHIDGRTEGYRQAKKPPQEQIAIKYKGRMAMPIIKLRLVPVNAIPARKADPLPTKAADPNWKALRYVRRETGPATPMRTATFAAWLLPLRAAIQSK